MEFILNKYKVIYIGKHLYSETYRYKYIVP